jgi:glycosyltransferase involved in cell wall biosynthesis
VRIAYILTRADSVGGATVHVLELARWMSAQGHETEVLVGGTGPVTEQFAAAGVRFYPVPHLRRPVNLWADTLAWGEVAARLRQFRPDLVSAHTAKAGWIGRSVCAHLGIPVIYTPHGLPIGDRNPGLPGRLYAAAERFAARWARLIVCVSGHERQLALQAGIGPAGRLTVVHNGVRDISPSLRATPAQAPPRLVSLARFEQPKDHATLLAAMALLRDTDWELELVGDGPEEGAARRLAARLGIASRVRFLGYQADPAPILARARVFVLATRSEGFPRSILEAMRSALPVVASRAGGIPESVSDGITGNIVAPGDPSALAAALRGHLAGPFLAQQFGAAGRQIYEAQFRLETMFDRTAAVYHSALTPDETNGD